MESAFEKHQREYKMAILAAKAEAAKKLTTKSVKKAAVAAEKAEKKPIMYECEKVEKFTNGKLYAHFVYFYDKIVKDEATGQELEITAAKRFNIGPEEARAILDNLEEIAVVAGRA